LFIAETAFETGSSQPGTEAHTVRPFFNVHLSFVCFGVLANCIPPSLTLSNGRPFTRSLVAPLFHSLVYDLNPVTTRTQAGSSKGPDQQ
jgi:hypothetical protein